MQGNQTSSVCCVESCVEGFEIENRLLQLLVTLVRHQIRELVAR